MPVHAGNYGALFPAPSNLSCFLHVRWQMVWGAKKGNSVPEGSTGTAVWKQQRPACGDKASFFYFLLPPQSVLLEEKKKVA